MALSGEQGHRCRAITVSSRVKSHIIRKPDAHTLFFLACQQTVRSAPSSHRERDKASKEPGETDTQLNFKRLFFSSPFDSQGHKLGERLDK